MFRELLYDLSVDIGIIYSKHNLYNVKTDIVNKNDRFYYKDASVLCLKNIYNINSEYIKFVLDSSVVQMQMQDQSKGTTVDTITIEKAKGYYIPLPPVTEQSRIVKAITLINHTIDKIAAIL